MKETPRLLHLRKRQRQLLSGLKLPPDALPGSLALTHRRCGKPSCHCAHGQGHPLWSLTFLAQGGKRVEPIPPTSVDVVRQRVDQGRRFQESVAELVFIYRI